MSDFWTEIENHFRDKVSMSIFKLNPSASQSEITDLEEHLGVELPLSLKEILLKHNGQDSGVGLFFGLQFLSVSGIKSQWDTWYSLKDDGLNEELSDSMSSRPTGFIKALYLNPKWIPLTFDYGGNHIGIDFDPDQQGKIGQIIAFGRDDDQKKLFANSFDEFIALFLEQLSCLKWSIDTDNGWLFADESKNVHYHDWGSTI